MVPFVFIVDGAFVILTDIDYRPVLKTFCCSCCEAAWRSVFVHSFSFVIPYARPLRCARSVGPVLHLFVLFSSLHRDVDLFVSRRNFFEMSP